MHHIIDEIEFFQSSLLAAMFKNNINQALIVILEEIVRKRIYILIKFNKDIKIISV